MTVSLRYCFNFIKDDSGGFRVLFEPEKVRKIIIEQIEEVENQENTDEIFFEDDVTFLRSLDPKEWKDQDHYQVLGLGKLRIKATDDDIRRAYRKMVLKYHPDKRKAQGEEIRSDDDFFTCITKAYEILGAQKRRSYDSIDPFFDDSLPSTSLKKEDFFSTFSKYFHLNSRWSEKKPVPSLGNPDTPREHVEKFYTFWYNFESWREFSYLDEEEKEKGQDRDERRWIEKQNKVARQKRKKEEMARIRSLVDLAYGLDPRIARFKQEDKDRKMEEKQKKLKKIQERKEVEMKEMLEKKMEQERIEMEVKKKNEREKQEKENFRKALKRERKQFRETCKTNNYFSSTEEENLTHMTAIEKICESLSLLEFENLNKHLLDNKKNSREIFLQTVDQIEKKLEHEREQNLKKTEKKMDNESINKKKQVTWNEESLQLLIKAVNLFPAGTNQRWEIIANFINQHNSNQDGSNVFNAKDVLNKAKDLLQNTDYSKNGLKLAANKQAYSNFEKDKQNARVLDKTEISTSQKVDVVNENVTMWTPNEQLLLEQALKTYSSSTPDRWDKIAECIPTRSKKDCMKRYKELVEIVKAKKAAQNAVKTPK